MKVNNPDSGTCGSKTCSADETGIPIRAFTVSAFLWGDGKYYFALVSFSCIYFINVRYNGSTLSMMSTQHLNVNPQSFELYSNKVEPANS
jgi:hypothetical protein